MQQAMADSTTFTTSAKRIFATRTSEFENQKRQYQDYIYKLEAKLTDIDNMVQTDDTELGEQQQPVLSKIQRMKEDFAILKKDLARVTGDKTNLTQTIEKMSCEREKLITRYNHLSAQNKKLQQISIDQGNLKAQKDNLAEENNEIRQKLACAIEKTKETECEKANLKQQLKKVTDDLAMEKQRYLKLAGSYKVLIKEYKVKDDIIEQNNEKMKATISRMTKENQLLSAQMETEYQKSQRDMEQIRITHYKLKQRENKISDELSVLSEENQRMQCELIEKTEHVNDAEGNVRALSQDKADLQDQLKQIRSNVTGESLHIKRYKQQTANLLSELNEKTILNEALKTKMGEMGKNIHTLEQEKSDLIKWNMTVQDEKDKLGKNLSEVQKGQNKLHRIYDELSDRQSGVRVGQEKTQVAIISRAPRPSNIHEQYAELSFQTASSIKQYMLRPSGIQDKAWKDFQDDFICGLFMESWTYMEGLRQRIVSQLANWIKQPLTSIPTETCTSLVAWDTCTLPSEAHRLIIMIMNLWRQYSSEIDVKAHCKNVKTRALHVSRWCKLSKQRAMLCMEQTDIDVFVEAVCKLSWQMVWQQPPMTFTTEGVGQPANEDLQKVLPGRDTVWPFMGRQVVERYLEPTLKQGEDILEKGTVIIGQKIK